MKSWRDEDLVMFQYGEHPQSDEIRRALERDPELARRLAAIARTLELARSVPVVEPPADYETEVWSRLRPTLDASTTVRTPRRLSAALNEFVFGAATWRLAALAATLAVAIGGAYLAGRASIKADPAREAAGSLPPSAFNAEERERLLLASVGDHLGSSSLLLTDLANAPSASAVGEERAWAETLLAGNRLYRQAAQRAGQRRIVSLLDELEPLLLELAHAPQGATMNDLQHQLEERDLLFKVRVFASRLEAGNAEKARPSRAL